MGYVKKSKLPEILVKRGKKKQKNDYIEDYVWRYFSTDIIVVDTTNFVVTLNTNGWETVTTKQRINEALSALDINGHIFQ